GFVAVIGAPNAGKSTLVNQIIGTKVSIVSPKVQTTRFRIRGIAMAGQTQIVFVDTPGIFEPKKRLERAMVSAAWMGAQDADLVCLVVDAIRGRDEQTRAIIERLKTSRRECFLVLNKVDLIQRERLLALAAELNERGVFAQTFMISALNGDGVSDLEKALAARMPEGEWMFPDDEVSDLPQRLLAAEITREKLFHNLHQELPYALSVITESWEEKPDGSARIELTIYVSRDSQKGIVLGQGGKRLKAIGQQARRELEELLDRKVHLFLFVKVHDRLWEDSTQFSEWGLDFDV
ncbi:MAG: GTPase Era, partial [Alphaproteobacteria bacterium RIFOXYD12_FULL_60_8]